MRFRRKKSVKMRGGMTHGWGAKKKHRGAGNRGGRGRAGSGKRGDAKKPSYWKVRWEGKQGFRSPTTKSYESVNVCDISNRLQALLAKGFASKKGDAFELDLSKIGYEKLLGTGKVSEKMIITCHAASIAAIKKVEDKGGKVVLKKVAQEIKAEAE